MLKQKQRCGWCIGDPLYEAYHDQEWGVPVYDDQELFEFLDNNPKVAEVNSNLTLTYRTDTELIDTLNRVTKIIE